MFAVFYGNSRILPEYLMSTVTLQLDLPEDWEGFRFPPALDARLQELLDRQDQQGSLSESERREAGALTELVDMLALLKARAERAAGPDS